MKKFVCGTALITTCYACGGNAWSPTASTETHQEQWAESETYRLAAKLGVKVKVYFTDKIYLVGKEHIAAAWYDRGDVYWYRPHLLKLADIDITWIAAHEVCHAKEFFHGPAHDACIVKLLEE